MLILPSRVLQQRGKYAGRLAKLVEDPPLLPGTVATIILSPTSYSASGTLPEGGTDSGFLYQWHESTTSGFTPDESTEIPGATSKDLPEQTGKTEGVTYYLKRVVTDSGLNTATTVEKSVTPITVTAFFSDDFESGDLSHTEGGFTWTDSNKSDPRDMVADIGVSPHSGTFANRFRYPAAADGTHGMAEQRFSLGGQYTELWVEYWNYIPLNYFHRDSTGEPDNAKFFRIHTGLTDFHITTELFRQSDGTSGMRRFLSGTRGALGTIPSGSGEPYDSAKAGIPDVVGPGMLIEPGEWTQMRFHFRSASARDVADGVAEWYANGSLIRQTLWDFWANDGADGGDPGQPAFVTGGYIWGWANAGYNEETKIYIDDIKFYSDYPGWGHTL